MIKIFFLIRSLNVGGAEQQLLELVRGLDKSRFNINVGLFYDEGMLREELHGMQGVRLLPLGKLGRWDLLAFGLRLARLLRKLKPDVLYSFLPEANLTGLIAGRLARVPRIVWGLRASNMDVKHYHWSFGATLQICSWLSSFPDAIISNSAAAIKSHKKLGFKTIKITVIPNGIDTKRFEHDETAGYKVRREWGVLDDEILIGSVARLDPMKDHSTFLRAARIFLDYSDKVRFVCVGYAQEPYKSKMVDLGNRLGLNEHLIWNEARKDMTAVYNALDIVTSSSAYGEGFPNVIGEAMACGVPCVVTDVGDSARIVGSVGITVPSENPKALADGWRNMLKRLNDKSYSIKEMTRARIVSHYNSEIFIQKTSRMFLSLL